MVIVLGIFDGFLMGFELGKKIENQEGLLDGDCVESLMGVVMGAIIGISVDEQDDDKVGNRLGRILGTVQNKEIGNCRGLSLY